MEDHNQHEEQAEQQDGRTGSYHPSGFPIQFPPRCLVHNAFEHNRRKDVQRTSTTAVILYCKTLECPKKRWIFLSGSQGVPGAFAKNADCQPGAGILGSVLLKHDVMEGAEYEGWS